MESLGLSLFKSCLSIKFLRLCLFASANFAILIQFCRKEQNLIQYFPKWLKLYLSSLFHSVLALSQYWVCIVWQELSTIFGKPEYILDKKLFSKFPFYSFNQSPCLYGNENKVTLNILPRPGNLHRGNICNSYPCRSRAIWVADQLQYNVSAHTLNQASRTLVIINSGLRPSFNITKCSHLGLVWGRGH